MPDPRACMSLPSLSFALGHNIASINSLARWQALVDLLWTGSDGSEAIDGPAQVKAPEQKSQEPVPVVLVANGVWPKSPNPRKHRPVDQVIRAPKALVAWKAVYSAA